MLIEVTRNTQGDEGFIELCGLVDQVSKWDFCGRDTLIACIRNSSLTITQLTRLSCFY